MASSALLGKMLWGAGVFFPPNHIVCSGAMRIITKPVGQLGLSVREHPFFRETTQQYRYPIRNAWPHFSLVTPDLLLFWFTVSSCVFVLCCRYHTPNFKIWVCNQPTRIIKGWGFIFKSGRGSKYRRVRDREPKPLSRQKETPYNHPIRWC